MNEISPVSTTITASSERSFISDAAELWQVLRIEAKRAADGEAMLTRFLGLAVLEQEDLASALAGLLARKLAEPHMPQEALQEVVLTALREDRAILSAAAADLAAVRTRDPASETYLTPFLYYKGFHALQWHRIGHFLWGSDRQDLAHFLQSRVSEVFAVDIHPAVPVGNGVFIDHGTGVVVGETSVIGNDVSILHEVTLGGTGKERGDRHPKVEDGVLLSAGAKVLGNITLGRNAKIGAGSVVLHDVPPCATVAGVPARVVGWCREAVPALVMDQTLPDYDYVI
ncbi:MAG: serine O-acetyltransferase [Aliidongia sp.]